MSLTSILHTQGILTHVFVVTLLCLGYFDYFLIGKPVRFFFEISSLTGKVLVNKFLAVCNCTLEGLKLASTFFQILYEDSLIFLKDAAEKFTFAIYLIKELYLRLEEIGWTILTKVFQIVRNFFDFLEFLYHTLETFKQLICYTGLTIWGFFINMPNIVIFLINGIIDSVKDTFNEILIVLKEVQEKIIHIIGKIYSLFFDVSRDSVYGLIIGGIIITILCIKFKDICYFLSSVILKFYQQVISLGINLWNGRFLEEDPRRQVDYSSEEDEKLCIVCQYHLKEIILFPCKHLCLCLECSKHLATNQPTCPICRSMITETFKVYM